MTRDEMVASVQVMRAGLRAALRCASRPEPDWAGAAKELDGVNELSCELWQECVRESWSEAALRPWSGAAAPTGEERGELS